MYPFPIIPYRQCLTIVELRDVRNSITQFCFRSRRTFTLTWTVTISVKCYPFMGLRNACHQSVDLLYFPSHIQTKMSIWLWNWRKFFNRETYLSVLILTWGTWIQRYVMSVEGLAVSPSVCCLHECPSIHPRVCPWSQSAICLSIHPSSCLSNCWPSWVSDYASWFDCVSVHFLVCLLSVCLSK